MQTITLPEIARANNVAPKIARARMRRAFADSGLTLLRADRWEFPSAERAKIVAIINPTKH